MNLLNAAGDVASIAAFGLGIFALMQWRHVRAVEVAEEALAVIDEARGMFEWARDETVGVAGQPVLEFRPPEERRVDIAKAVLKRLENYPELVSKIYRVGRKCEFRLGRNGNEVYERLQKLRAFLDRTRNAAWVLAERFPGSVESLPLIVRDAWHTDNDPLRLEFEDEAERLTTLLLNYVRPPVFGLIGKYSGLG